MMCSFFLWHWGVWGQLLHDVRYNSYSSKWWGTQFRKEHLIGFVLGVGCFSCISLGIF